MNKRRIQKVRRRPPPPPPPHALFGANDRRIVIGSHVHDDMNGQSGVALMVGGCGGQCVFYVPADEKGHERIESQALGAIVVSEAPPLPFAEVARIAARYGLTIAGPVESPPTLDVDGRAIEVGDVVATSELPPVGGVVVAVVGPAGIYRRPDGTIEAWIDPATMHVLAKRDI